MAHCSLRIAYVLFWILFQMSQLLEALYISLSYKALWVLTQSRLATLLSSLIARPWVGLQTLWWFRLKDLSIDEMVGAWCFGCLSGPQGFTCWISFALVFSFFLLLSPYLWFISFGRAKNWQKVAYLRRNPSPSVKWKTIAWMIWQDVEVSWIAGITFSKRGNGVKIWQKLHF